jgi:acyl carrier protein
MVEAGQEYSQTSQSIETVVNVIATQMGLDKSEVTPEKTLLTDLAMDSLDCVEMVMELEDRFEIEISDEEAEKCQTVQDVISLVNSKISPEG